MESFISINLTSSIFSIFKVLYLKFNELNKRVLKKDKLLQAHFQICKTFSDKMARSHNQRNKLVGELFCCESKKSLKTDRQALCCSLFFSLQVNGVSKLGVEMGLQIAHYTPSDCRSTLIYRKYFFFTTLKTKNIT